MDRHDEEARGESLRPNPELARFAFLIGSWRCEARLKQDDGSWESFPASWSGRYVLDGYAIMDEFRMTRPTGELLVLGVNVRSYDQRRGTWNLRWLNALDGSWTELGPEELGGVTMDGDSISYRFSEPVAAHPLTRATYFNISSAGFTWRGERSRDGLVWDEFMIIEARRTR